MKSWFVNGYDKKDAQRSTLTKDVVHKGEVEEVIAAFRKRYPDIVITQIALKGEWEEL